MFGNFNTYGLFQTIWGEVEAEAEAAAVVAAVAATAVTATTAAAVAVITVMTSRARSITVMGPLRRDSNTSLGLAPGTEVSTRSHVTSITEETIHHCHKTEFIGHTQETKTSTQDQGQEINNTGQTLGTEITKQSIMKEITCQNQETDTVQNQETDTGQSQKTDTGQSQKTHTGQNQGIDTCQSQKIDTGLSQEANTGQNQETRIGQNQETNTDQNQETDTGQNQETDTCQSQETNTDQSQEANTGQNQETDTRGQGQRSYQQSLVKREVDPIPILILSRL